MDLKSVKSTDKSEDILHASEDESETVNSKWQPISKQTKFRNILNIFVFISNKVLFVYIFV